MEAEIKGVVFNIQHYCIHDGPGIRTNVFLKGCPLNCLWCQNPESKSRVPQLMYNKDKCIGCRKCISICKQNCVIGLEEEVVTDRNICNACGECISACDSEARTIMGELMTVEDVYKNAAQDKLFYESSGGGVTLTGGEVLAQPAFAGAVLKRCKEGGIHTAIETCGFGQWKTLRGILEYVDVVLYDVKHMDTDMHKKCTGVGNELILNNLKKLSQEMKLPVIIRTPIVPGYNDSPSNMHAMGKFIKGEVPTCLEVNLLPYHSMGEGKLEQLELKEKKFESYTPSEEEMQKLRNIIIGYGVVVK